MFYLPFNLLPYELLEELIQFMFNYIKTTPVDVIKETDDFLDIDLNNFTKETNLKKFFIRSLTKYLRAKPGSIFGGAGFGSNFRTLINTKANSTNLRLLKDEIETYISLFCEQYGSYFILDNIEYDMSLLDINKIKIILTIKMIDGGNLQVLNFDIKPEENYTT